MPPQGLTCAKFCDKLYVHRLRLDKHNKLSFEITVRKAHAREGPSSVDLFNTSYVRFSYAFIPRRQESFRVPSPRSEITCLWQSRAWGRRKNNYVVTAQNDICRIFDIFLQQSCLLWGQFLDTSKFFEYPHAQSLAVACHRHIPVRQSDKRTENEFN